MALLHLDGCDTYAAIADVNLRYPGSSGGLSTTGGRFGGGAVFPAGIGMLVNISSTSSPVIVGGAINFGTADHTVLSFHNAAVSVVAEITITYAGGLLQIRRGSQSGTVIATSTASFVPGLWHHIEMKATVADAGGSVEIRMNGVAAVSFTGDTKNSGSGSGAIDRVMFMGNTNSGGGWDDMYILDTSGSAPLNDFLGDCRVNTLAPNSDASVQFTRSTAASNYLCVDEGRTNGDTDYVESATVGHIDRYGYGDLAAAVSTVHAVQTTTWARKTDATTRTMRNKILSGATTGNGASFALATSYAPYATPFSTDPATSAAWTVSAVNGLTAGFEVVS